MRDIEMKDYNEEIDDDREPYKDVDELLDEPAPGFHEAFSLIKRHHKLKQAGPLTVKDFDEPTLKMLREAGKNDPELSIMLIKRGLTDRDLAEDLTGRLRTKEEKATTAAKPRVADKTPGESAKTEEGAGVDVKTGAGGWSYKKTSDGYEIIEAPADQKSKVGLVVKPGMRGYDAIDEEMSMLS